MAYKCNDCGGTWYHPEDSCDCNKKLSPKTPKINHGLFGLFISRGKLKKFNKHPHKTIFAASQEEAEKHFQKMIANNVIFIPDGRWTDIRKIQ